MNRSVKRSSLLKPRLIPIIAVWLLSPTVFGAEPTHSLPADVLKLLHRQYTLPGQETRYLSGSVDLNGDHRPELIIHVVGPMACGTGGCPTWVFTPKGNRYSQVASISVTNPPIRAAASISKGWRNLIVHIGGGGAKPADIELSFNGRSYPSNPTVSGKHIKTATLKNSDIVIAEFTDFNDAKPIPEATVTAKAAVETPSFDCNKATTKTEQLICGDAALARLDRDLASAYNRSRQQWPAETQHSERQSQLDWISERNACASSTHAQDCIKSSYQRRLIELQIRGGALEAPTPVSYQCKEQEGQPFWASFYNQTEPRSVVLTFGNLQTIAFALPSGSGARYGNQNVDFWEHHGEATVTWNGKSFTCQAH